jgi:hypothetical protein
MGSRPDEVNFSIYLILPATLGLVSTIEELLGRKSSGPGQEI